jgi:mannose-6-phosphate isomerase-like protein (cupin superfamily)
MSRASFTTTVVLRGEQSAGAISAIENVLPARWDGPPLHHHEFDETFYVLDGQLTFHVRDELFTAGPGALAFAPGGVAHTLANLGDAPALPAALHAGGLRGLLRAPRGRGGRRGPARVGAGAAGHDRRRADRRARRHRLDRARGRAGLRSSRHAPHLRQSRRRRGAHADRLHARRPAERSRDRIVSARRPSCPRPTSFAPSRGHRATYTTETGDGDGQDRRIAVRVG